MNTYGLRKAMYVLDMCRGKKNVKPETIARLEQAVRDACRDVIASEDRQRVAPFPLEGET